MPSASNFITATSNDRPGFSNHRSIECLFNSLFRLTTKEHQMSALLSICEGNPPVTGGFPAQRDNNAKNVCIWCVHFIGAEGYISITNTIRNSWTNVIASHYHEKYDIACLLMLENRKFPACAAKGNFGQSRFGCWAWSECRYGEIAYSRNNWLCIIPVLINNE